MLCQISEASLDVRRFRPDTTGHELLINVGEMHERCEVGSEPHRIQNRESHVSGGERGEKSKHRRLQDTGRGRTCRFLKMDEQRRPIGQGNNDGKIKPSPIHCQLGIARNPLLDVF